MSDKLRMKRNSRLNLSAVHNGFAYQLQAVEAVKSMDYAALFHEQGLGKTKIGIDLALEWLKADLVDTILFVTKRGLVTNWSEEMQQHSHLRPRILDQNHSANFFAFNSPAPVLLTHYEVMRTEERRLALYLRTRRVGVILDEAHKIKNPDAEISKALHRLAPAFSRRIIMTGTPVANRPYDVWSQIYFLDHGEALGEDFDTFKADLELSNDLWADDRKRASFERSAANVFSRIAAFSVRETKASAGIELPEKIVENVPVELAPRQREMYDEIAGTLRTEVLVDGKLVEDDAEATLKRLLRLVQVASNPGLIDESYREEPAKLSALRRLLNDALAEPDAKAIIWSNFIDNVDWLARELESYEPVKVHGRIEMDERADAIVRFKGDPACRILVATPGSAKEGLTLTVANHAIFYDRSFSLDDYLQAQDRIHRISQQRTCYVWNLIARPSVDEWVDALLAAKRLAAQLIQSDVGKEEYEAAANYDFGRIVQQILGGQE